MSAPTPDTIRSSIQGRQTAERIVGSLELAEVGAPVWAKRLLRLVDAAELDHYDPATIEFFRGAFGAIDLYEARRIVLSAEQVEDWEKALSASEERAAELQDILDDAVKNIRITLETGLRGIFRDLGFRKDDAQELRARLEALTEDVIGVVR